MKRRVFNFLLFIAAPFTLLASIWLRFVTRRGINKISDKIFMKIGILPILDHYYQPLINPKKHLLKSLRNNRTLKGIDMNDIEQLEILSKFNFNEELLKFPLEKGNKIEFYYNHSSFKSGDAEYLYNVIRYFKPKKIIEIGCGNSTLMIQNALNNNKVENHEYSCTHFCVEPYEQPWLENIEVELIREKVENLEIPFFEQLEKNDILFIDSSHIIRPQGDVLFEYLEILPCLKSGVIVHIHDIFTPKDYLNNWILEHHILWNEQYLLEAFLNFNNDFKIMGALNYLSHNYHHEFASKCPIFDSQIGREPGSFWIARK